jgi:hypothetical protein
MLRRERSRWHGAHSCRLANLWWGRYSDDTDVLDVLSSVYAATAARDREKQKFEEGRAKLTDEGKQLEVRLIAVHSRSSTCSLNMASFVD